MLNLATFVSSLQNSNKSLDRSVLKMMRNHMSKHHKHICKSHNHLKVYIFLVLEYLSLGMSLENIEFFSIFMVYSKLLRITLNNNFRRSARQRRIFSIFEFILSFNSLCETPEKAKIISYFHFYAVLILVQIVHFAEIHKNTKTWNFHKPTEKNKNKK